METGSKDVYKNLFQYLADGLVICDLDGKITVCNQAFAKLVGKSEAEIIGMPITNLFECSCLDHDKAQLHLAETDNPNVHNALLLNREAIDLTVPVSHVRLADGFLSVIYIVQTHSVQQAQTEFVSTVSHELRTPLTSIKGFADTILRAGDRLDQAQQRRYIGIIKDQADRLTRLVEDLLAVSRLESRKMQLTIRALDLESIVQRVSRNLADKAQNHQIVVRIPQGLPAVWADADRLEQILTNLIDNAIKYSPKNTVVTVSAKADTNAKPEMVEFSVHDQGEGIAQEHQAEIFSKFYRLDNPLVRQTEGTGLGLYITKSLILALGGDISVDSAPGSTTFTVKIPSATLEEQAARGRG